MTPETTTSDTSSIPVHIDTDGIVVFDISNIYEDNLGNKGEAENGSKNPENGLNPDSDIAWPEFENLIYRNAQIVWFFASSSGFFSSRF